MDSEPPPLQAQLAAAAVSSREPASPPVAAKLADGDQRLMIMLGLLRSLLR